MLCLAAAIPFDDKLRQPQECQSMPAMPVPAGNDELLSLIYAGPLEARPWQSFLDYLRLHFDCDVAALSLRVRQCDLTQLNVFSRRDAASDAEINRSYKVLYGQRDPLGDALSKPGDILTLDEVISTEQLHRTIYYQHLMQPFGLEHQLGMRVGEPGGWQSNIGLMNSAGRGNFGASEKQFFQAFRPHLERALALYVRIKRSESEKRIFEEALDRLSVGAFILDGAGRLIDMNHAARNLMRHRDDIAIHGKQLSLAPMAQHERLRRAIKSALAWQVERQVDCFIDALRLDRQDGSHLSILVRAIAVDPNYQGESCPSVIVYACDSTRHTPAPERLVAQLFGLSPAEAGLAVLLAHGLTLMQAAHKLNITENTARTYSKRMFEKVRVTRQTDLVRVILTSVAPLASDELDSMSEPKPLASG
jgi:DNA-binding CsgD family transcriptional regulator